MNIAGVANIGTGVLEAADFAAVERLFTINLYGQLRVIQAFLPLIRKNAPGSRSANYSSGASPANPVGAAAYQMPRHEIGRGACRERGCQDGWVRGIAEYLN